MQIFKFLDKKFKIFMSKNIRHVTFPMVVVKWDYVLKLTGTWYAESAHGTSIIEFISICMRKKLSQVLKLLGGSVKKRRKARGLTSYGSVSSLPTSSVSSRPVTRHHDKRRSHVIDDRMKKAKDIKVNEINGYFCSSFFTYT